MVPVQVEIERGVIEVGVDNPKMWRILLIDKLNVNHSHLRWCWCVPGG